MSSERSEAPRASAQGIFIASAKPAEAYAPSLIYLPTYLYRNAWFRQARSLAGKSFGGYPFRIHPRPSGRGILRRRV